MYVAFFKIWFQVAKYVRDRRRRRRHRLPRSQLKKITIKKFKKGEGNDVCAICLDEFEEGDKLRVLPCRHRKYCGLIAHFELIDLRAFSSTDGLIDWLFIIWLIEWLFDWLNDFLIDGWIDWLMDARFAVIYFVCITEYHCKCVDPWLLNNKRVCPVCKRKVIPGDSSDDEGNTGQPTQEPSESTPLLSPAHNLGGGPLENDLPVQGAPQMLVNIEFTSDDEYDADTEDAHENIGTNYDREIVVVTSALSAPQSGSSSSYRTEENSQNYSPPSSDFSSAVNHSTTSEERDVPLIRLSDSQDMSPTGVPTSHGWESLG